MYKPVGRAEKPTDEDGQQANPGAGSGSVSDEEEGYLLPDDADAAPPRPPPECWGRRHSYGAALFLGAMVLYAQRAGMAVGIVRMQALFGWDKKTQGILLSAFYVGYASMQIPTGWLAARFGGVQMILLSVAATSMLALAAPYAAFESPWAFFCLRAMQGVAQAPFFSATYGGCRSRLSRVPEIRQ